MTNGHQSIRKKIVAGALSASMLLALAPAAAPAHAQAAPQSQGITAKAVDTEQSQADEKAAQGFLDLMNRTFMKKKVTKDDVSKLQNSWKKLTKSQKDLVNRNVAGQATHVINEIADRVKKKNDFKATVKGKTIVNVKRKNLKKKGQSFQIVSKRAKGRVTYFAMDAAEEQGIVKISKKGKVTFKKGTPKGEYEIVATDAGNKTYRSQARSIVFIVK